MAKGAWLEELQNVLWAYRMTTRIPTRETPFKLTFGTEVVCERPRLRLVCIRMLGQTHENGWSRVIASQNGGSTNYIFSFRLRVLQWSPHLFNYWKKKIRKPKLKNFSFY